MFFITTYGFLNLSSALESWASTDFRPEFRIPKTISIIGSLACFLVMILLDFPAMVGATIVLGALFLYLTRKQLTLESGDTWEGVWSSVVRTGLQKLNRRETHLRNWRPNMLLFSGGEQARPHLVELGEWLVRARGMLTDFVLKENPALDSPLSRIRSREADGEIPVPGVFSKEMSCQNIYQGIDAVSQVYGFADINPNAILMGWGKNSRDPRQFATLIGHLQARDFNVLLLRYDKGRAFGKHARIDLWWRGGNNNATLSLNMLKFLSGSDEWREAEIRLLIVINDSATLNRVHTNMTRLLEEERLEATVKVINNAVEQRPFGEILVAESADADLTLLGLARVQESQLNDFVARTESTLSGLGTVLLSHASSYFKPMYVGIDEDAENVVETATAADWDAAAAALPPITLEGSAGDAESRQQLLRLLSEASTTLEGEIYRFYQQLELIQQNQARLGETLADLLERNLSALQKGPQADSPRRRKQLVRARSDFLFHTQQLIAEFEAHLEKDQQTVLSQALKELREGIVAIPRDLPAEVMLYLDEADINPAAGDSAAEKGFKARQRFRQKFFKTVPHKKVPLGFLLTKTLETRIFPVLEKQLGEMALESYRFATGLQKWVNRSRDVFGLIEKGLPGGGKVSETDSPDLGAEMNRLAANLENRSLSTAQALLSESRAAVQAAAEQAVLLENPRKSRRRMAYFRVPPA
ncbi:MAG TPA: hypothetical protein PKV71_15750, partial [Calditrichia bacterium]|nr:hypothetical protein [Calditrichia bacterium]